jgi:hypothetical protein
MPDILEGKIMKKLLELSGMWIILIGAIVEVVGIVVLITTEDNFILYVAGYAIAFIGAALLFWLALRDRLRARKAEDLDDVGFH